MQHSFGLSFRGYPSVPHDPYAMEIVQIQRPLHRVLEVTGRSIDEVVNCPIAKRQVLGYYKLHLEIRRCSEITDLERQWNEHGLL